MKSRCLLLCCCCCCCCCCCVCVCVCVWSVYVYLPTFPLYHKSASPVEDIDPTRSFLSVWKKNKNNKGLLSDPVMTDCVFPVLPVFKSNNKRQNCDLTFRQQQKKQPDGSSAHVSADDAAAKRISATALAGRCSHAEKAWIMSVTTFQWRNNCACVKLVLIAYSIGWRSKYIKGSKERLFIMTQTHYLQIFGPFVKLQDNT